VIEYLKQMNLRDTQINKIVQKMKQMLARVEKGENEIKRLEEKIGISAREARTYLKKLKEKALNEKKLLRNRGLSKADLQEIDRSAKMSQKKIDQGTMRKNSPVRFIRREFRFR
jgi:Na+/phosphate symporter